MTESSFELIKKHGATGVLFLWLIITNMKVNEIEGRLYDCLEDSAQSKNTNKANKDYIEQGYYFAVLTNKRNRNGLNKRYIKA